MLTRNLFFIGLMAALVPACGTAEDLSDDVIESGDELDGKADGLSKTSTFYTVRQDLRRCISPLCGGAWVKRLNFTTTKCADGKYASECYVAEENHTKLGLTSTDLDTGHALIFRGSIKPKSYSGFGNMGEFVATEAWTAASDNAPTDLFYRVTNTGVRCFSHPCPTFHEAKLNSTVSRNLASLDLAKTGATADQIGDAYAATTTPDGILVSGTHFRETGPAGSMYALRGAQFYTRVVAKGCKTDDDCPQPFCLPGGPCPHFTCDVTSGQCVQAPTCQPVLCELYCKYGFAKNAAGCEICSCNAAPVAACQKTGCSGHICSDRDVITTCEFRPEYACYQQATCERQADGNCGFTQTSALYNCLNK
jgi:hypothetical protein